MFTIGKKLNRLRVNDSNLYNLSVAQRKVAENSADDNLILLVEKAIQKRISDVAYPVSFDCLIVDDNVDLLKSVQMILSLEGISVQTASSINEMKKKLHESFFRTLIVDINVPIESDQPTSKTWGIIADLCKHNVITDLIVISAFANESHNVEYCQQYNVVSYIQKPFNARILVPYIKKSTEKFAKIDEEIAAHPAFNTKVWRKKTMRAYYRERLQAANGDYELASRLCQVSSKTIRRTVLD